MKKETVQCDMPIKANESILGFTDNLEVVRLRVEYCGNAVKIFTNDKLVFQGWKLNLASFFQNIADNCTN